MDRSSKYLFKYLGRKLLFLVLTYIVSITIVFILPRVIPGNPLSQILSRLSQTGSVNPEAIRASEKVLLEQYGLDKPWLLHIKGIVGLIKEY